MRLRNPVFITAVFLTVTIASGFGIGMFQPRSSLARRSLPFSSPCPAISVVGPPGKTKSGDLLIFEAKVLGGDMESLTFTWTVSPGKIEGEQGKPTVAVRTDKSWEWRTVKATVEIGGLDPNCPNTASAEAKIEPSRMWIGAYSYEWAKGGRKSTLNQAAIETKSVANGKVALVGYKTKNKTEEDIRKQLYLDLQYLESKGIDPNKVTVIIAKEEAATSQTKLYIADAKAVFDDLGTTELTTLLGTVKSKNAGVPGVPITATKTDDNNIVYTTTTRQNGSYYIRPIVNGKYTVTAEKDGVKKSADSKVIQPQTIGEVNFDF